MKIKSLPQSERPVERAFAYGIDSLSNAELIALIIRIGSKEDSALELANKIISQSENGIYGIASASPKELIKFCGIGKSKAGALAAAAELGRRLSRKKSETAVINTAKDVADLMMPELRHLKKEHFISLLMDVKGKVFHIDRVSVGELSGAPAHPREVFTLAVRMSAASVIFVHNHPSGDPQPSPEDIRTTKRLCESGKILGIKVLDHIIIGDGEYISMMNMNLI
ncbi:MAG: DNA repair protein RadC [Eubacterium sp.]|nr:DNA repair protein RadC [Eubacterium sp.]